MRRLALLLTALPLAACAGSAPPSPNPGAEPAAPPAAVTATAQPADAEPAAPRWRWTDYEVVGQLHITREEVVALMPQVLGQPFDSDRGMLTACGETLAASLDVVQARCTWVTFFNGEAYLLAEIVEPGEEVRIETRPAPAGQVELATPEIVAVYRQLRERLSANYAAGVDVGENSDAGHLDFREPGMHPLVEELRAALPPYREALLRVLAEDADRDDRADAAWMLNWAGDLSASAAAVAASINDPDGLVRNDVSRFLLYAIPQTDDRAVLRLLVDELAVQLSRPSHGDRNKAIYGLTAVVAQAPDLAPYLDLKAGAWIDRLAAQSILPNVGGAAKELRATLDAAGPAPPRTQPP